MGASVVVAAFIAAAVAGQRQVNITANQNSGGGGTQRKPDPVRSTTAAQDMEKYGEGGSSSIGAHYLGGRTGLEEGHSVLTQGRTAGPIAPNKKKLAPSLIS